MNNMLGVLLDKELPEITTRAFRPALPSILAREGGRLGGNVKIPRALDVSHLPPLCEGRADGGLEGVAAKTDESVNLRN